MEIFINGRFLTQKLTGVQRYGYELTKQLIQKGVPVKIMMPRKPVFEAYDTANWPIERYGSVGGHLWEQVQLPFYLSFQRRRLKSPIFLLNFCNLAPVFFGGNIVALHDISFIDNPQWFKKKFVFFYKLVVPQIVKRSLSIVTVSEFSRERIELFYQTARGKVTVIHSACAISSPDVDDQELALLKKYDLRRAKFVLSVSSIEPRKNLNALIKAFNDLKDETINLVLVGSGGDAFNSVALSTEENRRIKLTGYLSDTDLQILYRNALCFCYPSLYEGFGLPPLEAMAKGCPVIVSDLPSLREVCADAALYINPHDTDTIRFALKKLINDPSLHYKLRDKGGIRVSKFSFSKSADELIGLLNERSDELK